MPVPLGSECGGCREGVLLLKGEVDLKDWIERKFWRTPGVAEEQGRKARIKELKNIFIESGVQQG